MNEQQRIKHRDYQREYRELHKDDPEFHAKRLAQQRAWYEDNPERRLFLSARERARKHGVPCTIKHTDIVIPTHCPILGIELKRNKKGKGPISSSPSLDRIIPELGYTAENILVISHRANQLKNNATREEIKKLYDWSLLNM